MDERELKLRHTSEGAEKVRADVESVAQAEGKLGDAVDGAGKSTEELRIRKQSLLTVLNRIHPGLGAYVDSLLQAARVTGELGNVNITLEGILGGVQAAVLKNASALALLGAGGAAVAAVMFLINQIRALKSELEDVLKLQDRIAEQNRKLIDKALVFEEMLVEAVEAGEVPPPDEERKKAMRAGYQKSVAEGLSEKKAFDVEVGQDFVSDEQREFIKTSRGETDTRKRISEELSKGKELSSRDLEFITKQGFSEEDVKKLRNVIVSGNPATPPVFGTPPPLHPEEFQVSEPQLYELAVRLGLLNQILGQLGQSQQQQQLKRDTRGFFGKFLDEAFTTVRHDRRSDPAAVLDDLGEVIKEWMADPERAAPTSAEREARGPWGSPSRWKRIRDEEGGPARGAVDGESISRAAPAAAKLERAADALEKAAQRLGDQADRSAERLSRNGTTPRMIAAIGREG